MAVPSDADLLTAISDIITKASDIVSEIRAKGFETYKKADKSLVTDADKASEKYILEKLRDLTPSIPVIAEEEVSAGVGHSVEDEFWLVDPLDGTSEFAAGKDSFTINIGLIRHRAPILGAVCLPASNELFIGHVQHGAEKIFNGKHTPIHTRPFPEEGITVLTSRHDAERPELPLVLAHEHVREIQHIGSSVKFVRIAEGRADFYPRLLPTMEWDTAAPQAIIEAAGGSLYPLGSQSPLRYGKPRWRNPHFICSGRPLWAE